MVVHFSSVALTKSIPLDEQYTKGQVGWVFNSFLGRFNIWENIIGAQESLVGCRLNQRLQARAGTTHSFSPRLGVLSNQRQIRCIQLIQFQLEMSGLQAVVHLTQANKFLFGRRPLGQEYWVVYKFLQPQCNVGQVRCIEQTKGSAMGRRPKQEALGPLGRRP